MEKNDIGDRVYGNYDCINEKLVVINHRKWLYLHYTNLNIDALSLILRIFL